MKEPLHVLRRPDLVNACVIHRLHGRGLLCAVYVETAQVRFDGRRSAALCAAADLVREPPMMPPRVDNYADGARHAK